MYISHRSPKQIILHSHRVRNKSRLHKIDTEDFRAISCLRPNSNPTEISWTTFNKLCKTGSLRKQVCITISKKILKQYNIGPWLTILSLDEEEGKCSFLLSFVLDGKIISCSDSFCKLFSTNMVWILRKKCLVSLAMFSSFLYEPVNVTVFFYLLYT